MNTVKLRDNLEFSRIVQGYWRSMFEIYVASRGIDIP